MYARGYWAADTGARRVPVVSQVCGACTPAVAGLGRVQLRAGGSPAAPGLAQPRQGPGTAPGRIMAQAMAPARTSSMSAHQYHQPPPGSPRAPASMRLIEKAPCRDAIQGSPSAVLTAARGPSPASASTWMTRPLSIVSRTSASTRRSRMATMPIRPPTGRCNSVGEAGGPR